HQHNLVGEVNCLVNIVSDHEHGLSGFLADTTDLILQGAAGKRVERGNGSSINMIFGSIDSARAMPTRCFIPPDNSEGRLCSAPVSPTRSMNFCACTATFALSQSRHFDDTA